MYVYNAQFIPNSTSDSFDICQLCKVNQINAKSFIICFSTRVEQVSYCTYAPIWAIRFYGNCVQSVSVSLALADCLCLIS